MSVKNSALVVTATFAKALVSLSDLIIFTANLLASALLNSGHKPFSRSTSSLPDRPGSSSTILISNLVDIVEASNSSSSYVIELVIGAVVSQLINIKVRANKVVIFFNILNSPV